MYILKKYKFEPNYNNIVQVANNNWVQRLPLYEHLIDQKVIYDITGNKPYDLIFSKDMEESKEGYRQLWDFWRQMGYDTMSIEYGVCSVLVGNGALGQHKEGCIKNREDFEKYPWDEIPNKFFEVYSPYIKNLAETCPTGMKAIGGVANGVFEAVQDIIGYVNLCYIKADDEELFADIFKAMGDLEYKIWDRFMDEFSDIFCVLRFGDDLGYKSTTLLDPNDVKKHIIPQYKRIIDKVHSKNKKFLLHSCGNIFCIFDDLINVAGIDAKHSNEDQIAHFSVWVDKYGDRIGNFGGIDTDVLCRQSNDYIEEYIIDCIEKVKGHGGIAFSSGNSIPDYVPTDKYITMVETVRKWRQDNEV